jgi:lysophospholipase L1-like esterase
MSHTFENYFSPIETSYLADSLAEAILRSCVKYGPKAIETPNDYEARANAVADNAKIDRYNGILKELAAEKGVLYLNVAEEFKDADGCLPNSASPKDGIHFGSSWYRKWFDYLRTHGASPTQ